MAYNKLNKLLFYKKVIHIVNENFIDGITTYAGIWREKVNKVYPMTYETFLKIINYPNIEKEIEVLKNQKKQAV